MYTWLISLLVITIILGVLGFSTGVVALKVLFWIALAVLVIGFISTLFTRPRQVPNV